jgi:hypothetical protein
MFRYSEQRRDKRSTFAQPVWGAAEAIMALLMFE